MVYNTATAGDVTPGFYYWNGTAWEAIDNSPTTYTIGDWAQGGIVFWVDETGQHGLICAKEDQNGVLIMLLKFVKIYKSLKVAKLMATGISHQKKN